MARKTKAEAERTRARILASALRLFVSKGYERTTFNDIASRLKMTKGAVYWHFESKEALLVALVGQMIERFADRKRALLKEADITYPAVADMMVKIALATVESPDATSFFMLMMTRMRWGTASMMKVREEILSKNPDSPYHLYLRALGNDAAAGRVRRGVDARGVAAASMAVWDGLVRARIEGFLDADLETTLKCAFDAIWRSVIHSPERPEQSDSGADA